MRKRSRLPGLLCIALISILPATARPADAVDEPPVIAVVVPANAQREALEIADLALIFKRKRLLWNGGARIVPVNLPADHPLRRQFSQIGRAHV
jgi:hypothetical protein